ncbi:hypothetical protein [Caballeronia sp. LZ034LL]|uniref:hypothetical protein n=1 Tax=Caballeronia sp. LZ034LL TaxID=3038567 RepID=UPI0028623600|nr:hypothetical protein [Caballeronia sp. LZ034LL]MDR5835707.1 hypothetical protein [Caballeronia sp. LZ034LL]
MKNPGALSLPWDRSQEQHQEIAMNHSSASSRVLIIGAGALTALASSVALAGGNGNGGNGSGGSHGAATAGMTYHSEPVSSPWNRVPGDMSMSSSARQHDNDASTTASRDMRQQPKSTE